MLEYAAGRVALFVVNLLPERPAYAIAAGLGQLFFRCSRRRQRYALHFLRNAYGAAPSDVELLAVARQATGNIFKVVLDTVRVIPVIRRGQLRDYVDLSAYPNVAPPYIAVTPHLGSWEIAGIACATLHGEAHAIAKVFKNPLLQRFILSNRQRAGLYIHPKRGGIRALSRALDRGCIGLQVVDQHQRLRGVQVPFFGEMASTERSAAVLSLRRGYPIVVGAAVRVGPGFRFKMLALPPLHTESSDDPEADVARIATEVNRRLETLILAHANQYLWIHNRYRTQSTTPGGDSSGGGDARATRPGTEKAIDAHEHSPS